MAAVAWPTSGVPNPEVYRISPRPFTIYDDSPFTGVGERSLRYHQWHVYIQWNNTTGDDYWGLFGHFAQSDGGRVTFQIPIFSYRAKRGTKSGTVNAAGSYPAGATSIGISGGTGTLLRGDWIQINQITDVPRAYVVTSSESGGVIQFRPGLRAPITAANVVHHFGGGGFLYDTMELPPGTDFAASMPSPLVDGGYFQPFPIELVTALRISP